MMHVDSVTRLPALDCARPFKKNVVPVYPFTIKCVFNSVPSSDCVRHPAALISERDFPSAQFQ